MSKSYPEITHRIAENLKGLRREQPDVSQAFNTLARAATAEGALDTKTKELIALAIGVAQHCDGCIGFHTRALVRLGATRAEVGEALSMAVYMGGGPAMMYAADAIMAYDQFVAQGE